MSYFHIYVVRGLVADSSTVTAVASQHSSSRRFNIGYKAKRPPSSEHPIPSTKLFGDNQVRVYHLGIVRVDLCYLWLSHTNPGLP